MRRMSKSFPTSHPIIGLAPALSVMEKLGYSVQRCLAKTGILLSQLDDHRQFVTLQQELRFYRNVLELSGDPAIGLKIGEAYVPQRYGILGYALISAHTLRHVMVLAANFGDLTFTWFGLSYTVLGASTRFSLQDRFEIEPAVSALLHDRDSAAAWMDFSEVLGRALPLERVALPHDGHGRAKTYQDYFQCPVEFGGTGSHLEFSSAILDQPLPNRDAAASELLGQQCQLLLSKMSKQNRLIDSVRQLLLARPGFFPGIEGVAKKLGISVRTLQRKLSEESTSFQDVLDEVRFQLAKDYLSETDIPLQEIGLLLGYNEPSNFTHAFKRWAGCSPSEFRLLP